MIVEQQDVLSSRTPCAGTMSLTRCTGPKRPGRKDNEKSFPAPTFIALLRTLHSMPTYCLDAARLGQAVISATSTSAKPWWLTGWGGPSRDGHGICTRMHWWYNQAEMVDGVLRMCFCTPQHGWASTGACCALRQKVSEQIRTAVKLTCSSWSMKRMTCGEEMPLERSPAARRAAGSNDVAR